MPRHQCHTMIVALNAAAILLSYCAVLASCLAAVIRGEGDGHAAAPRPASHATGLTDIHIPLLDLWSAYVTSFPYRLLLQDNANMLKGQLEQQGKAVDTIIGNMRVLESKLAEAKMKKDTLKARAQSAKSARAINDMVSWQTATTTQNAELACAALAVAMLRCAVWSCCCVVCGAAVRASEVAVASKPGGSGQQMSEARLYTSREANLCLLGVG